MAETLLRSGRTQVAQVCRSAWMASGLSGDTPIVSMYARNAARSSGDRSAVMRVQAVMGPTVARDGP